MDFPSARDLVRRTGITLLALLALALPLYVAVVSGLVSLGGLSRGDLVPWYAHFDPRVSVWTAVAAAVAAGVLRWSPRLLRVRSRGVFLRRLLAGAVVLWACVALSDGIKQGERRTGLVPANGIAYPFERTAHEYIGDVPRVERMGAVGLLRAWHTEEVQNTLAWHSRTHPPGAVLLLAGLDRIGLGGALRSGLAVLLLGSLSLVFVLLWARLHLGEHAARLATLLFAVAPGTTLFFATSMETVFTLLSVLALWAMTVGVRREGGAATIAVCLAAGAALALATFFTFASLLVVFTVGAVEGVRAVRGSGGASISGTIGRLALQVAGFGVFVAGLALLGWDPAGSVRAALAADALVMGSTSGPVQWVAVGVANLAAFALSLGAASVAMLASVQVGRASARAAGTVERPTPLPDVLVGAGIAVTIAAFSTLFTLEVERIWIVLFAPVLVGLLAAFEAESDRRGTDSGSTRPVHPAWTRSAFVRIWLALLLAQTLLTEVLAETRW